MLKGGMMMNCENQKDIAPGLFKQSEEIIKNEARELGYKKLNKKRIRILTLFLLLVVFMCILFVPQSIVLTGLSSQNVPHSSIIGRVYEPIWYSYYKIRSGGRSWESNCIDCGRLFIQMFALTLVCGILYIKAKE